MTSVDECLYDGETTFIGRKGSINKPFYYNGKFWTVDTLSIRIVLMALHRNLHIAYFKL